MNDTTFDFFSITTVPPTYSWDKGVPYVELSSSELITNTTLLTGTDSVYIGYAPFVMLSLSSSVGTPAVSSIAIRRTADFGDFYNSETNFASVYTLIGAIEDLSDPNIDPCDTARDVVFCHNYIMPGLYSVSLIKNEYILREIKQTFQINCYERYCEEGIEWSWNKRNCNLYPFSQKLSWNDTTKNKQYEKRWIDRPNETCTKNSSQLNGLYIQPSLRKQTQTPLSWQWYNFLCSSPNNPKNNPITWKNTEFQQANELTWSQVSGPGYEIGSEEITWRWESISLNSEEIQNRITWDETRVIERKSATWDSIGAPNCITVPREVIELPENTTTKQSFLRVIEIPPTAYLNIAEADPKKISPLTVRLTPRFSKCGSFPIEKIVWDLGDGTPLLTQKRTDPTTEHPFVFSNALTADWQDPRNFDVVHTYRKTFDSSSTFYPSMTAYASSTGTSDCVSTQVGPLRLKSLSATSFNLTLLQNELTDHGKIIAGEIDSTAVFWKTNK